MTKLRERCDRLPVVLVLALFTMVVLRCAWISDDAYITFRTVDNFVSGHGLTWNTDERVQAFTHPLWALVLAGAYAITREIHLTAIAIAAILSIGTALLFAARLAQTALAALVGVMVLSLSRAFVDYSTSGLENPLTHLLLAVYFVLYLRRAQTDRSFLLLALLAGLVTLNRMDTALLVLPPLLQCAYARRSLRTVGLLILGFAPFILWELFALLYYGFPFPNTAYAKLNTGLAASLLLKQGLFYLANSLRTDPLTLSMVVAGLVVPLVIGPRRHAAISVGLAFYLLYVVRIGGDFMSGRFLTAPLLAAVIVLAQSPAARSVRAVLLTLGLVVLLGLSSPRPTVFSGESYGFNLGYMDAHGVSDERAYYYQGTSLLSAARGVRVPDHQLADAGRVARTAGEPVVVAEAIGMLGFEAGPAVHIVDVNALADPLLARLPVHAGADWRIGHIHRPIPEGYLDSLRSGQNVITDPQVACIYERLQRITRGPLLDRQRLREIVRMNVGL